MGKSIIKSERPLPLKTAARRADIQTLMAAFIADQDVKESSRNLYGHTLGQYFKWITDTHRDLNALTRADIIEFKEYLQDKGLSALTVGSYIVTVRKFYEWSETRMLYPNIAKGIKVPRRKQAFKKQHLSDDKSAELLEHLRETNLRDFAIVNLILRTGLRTIEVIRANVEDITFLQGRRILRVWGKGHTEKDDFVILTDKAYQPIADYLQTRRNVRGGSPLFVSSSHQNFGERLTTRTISGICKEGLRAIGIDGKEFTAHSLRHTTASAILKHGGDMSAVQAVLRHSSLSTSQIYVESIKEELRIQNAPEMMLDAAF